MELYHTPVRELLLRFPVLVEHRAAEYLFRDREDVDKPLVDCIPDRKTSHGEQQFRSRDHLHNLKDDEPERIADVSQWHEEGKEVEMPLHPLVYAYDLLGHVEVIAHITDLKPHQYQNDIDRYLVIPQETRKSLNVLRQALRLQDRDVISGKAGGCLILLKGDPGLGKTLTAQVFAEQNNRPLYELQCSQLGISPPEVEENLRNALLRARRWPKQHDLPDNITNDLEKRLQRADWNELLKPILRGIPAKIDVVDTTGPERTQRSGRASG